MTTKAKPRTNESHKEQEVPATFEPGFISKLDGRTEIARALRSNYDEIVGDIGDQSDISHVKRSLIERFCWLEAILQTLEHEMATGKVEKSDCLGKWIQAVNSLSGLAKVLGIERQASSRPWIGPANNGASK